MQADNTLQYSSKMASSPTILFGQSLKFNDFAEYVDRLTSFETWPQQMNQDKYTLAQAGFIYKKEGDIVECFACGVKLSQWKSSDNPLTEHKKWSPECVYLKLTGARDRRTQSSGCGASSVFADI